MGYKEDKEALEIQRKGFLESIVEINRKLENVDVLKEQRKVFLKKAFEVNEKLMQLEDLEENDKEVAKQNAATTIANKVQQAMSLIRECEKIAREHEISFSLDVAYGMGGTFSPSDGDGWMPSSHSC